MTEQNPKKTEDYAERPLRRSAFVPVKIRKHKLFGLMQNDAKLVDISSKGFKLELRSTRTIKPGDEFWMKIPLSTWNDPDKQTLECKCECKWVNAENFQMGGIIKNQSPETQELIEEFIVDLTKSGRLAI